MILNAAISALNAVALDGGTLPATDLFVDVVSAIGIICAISLLCRLFRIIIESRKDD